MRFKLHTLVDVTPTNARRGQEALLQNQQANFNTIVNTIGLRTNASEYNVSVEKQDIKKFNFGSNYTGKHNVWTVEFFVEAQDSTNLKFMNEDFDLVPIITGLNETANLDKDMFVTLSNHGRTNIFFEKIDK